MKAYESLYRLYKGQAPHMVFAHFYAVNGDYDEPFKIVARQTWEGIDAWTFHQDKFRNKHPNTAVPKLKNYLNYTFKRLVDLEASAPGKYFVPSADGEWITFNTGLQNIHQSDLLAVFQKYKEREGGKPARECPDFVFRGCWPPNDRRYREPFGTQLPELAWYSHDSRDYVFDLSYHLERDVFDHLFERAKERAGLPTATDEVVRNYLRGALENLIPKMRRNYKVAIPVWYVEERRMQVLLPFYAADGSNISCFLVERDDTIKCYRPKTIFDLDQAYFSARLITRPDKEWLNP